MTTEKKLTIIPVSLYDEHVQQLVTTLNRYQLFLYGRRHCNLESMDALQKKHAFLLGAYYEDKLIGIGAVKMKDNYGEIKRMIVEKKYHGSGAAAKIIHELELYTKQKGKKQVNLETGRLQYAAIRFYQKHGYSEIRQFGEYKPNPVSIYFQKNV